MQKVCDMLDAIFGKMLLEDVSSSFPSSTRSTTTTRASVPAHAKKKERWHSDGNNNSSTTNTQELTQTRAFFGPFHC